MATDVEKKTLKRITRLDKKFDGKVQYVVEIVQFNDSEPQLIKQQYYKNSDGEWLPGKLKGFTYDDLKFMKNSDERKEVLETLKS